MLSGSRPLLGRLPEAHGRSVRARPANRPEGAAGIVQLDVAYAMTDEARPIGRSLRLPWGTDESSRPRDPSVETLRGLAVALMVAGHVIGSRGDLGMRVADDSGYRYFVEALIFLRMPLFTVISGFVYDMRPVRPGAARMFLAGKTRRLLVPFVTIATLQFAAKSVVPGVNDRVELSEWWRIYVFPFDHFWFVQALALTFFAVAWLDSRGSMRSLRGFLWVFAVALALHLYLPTFTTLFALPLAVYLLPYFLLGVGMHRFSSAFAHPAVTRIALLGFAIAFAMHQLSLLGIWHHRFEQSSPGALVIGGCGCLLLLRARVTWIPLAWLGSYAYTIYLLHVFPAAASRIALLRSGADHHALVFASGMVAGLLVPIAADRVLRRFTWSRFAFLGLAARRSTQRMPAPDLGVGLDAGSIASPPLGRRP
jgi:glucans biosynthesis protein C